MDDKAALRYFSLMDEGIATRLKYLLPLGKGSFDHVAYQGEAFGAFGHAYLPMTPSDLKRDLGVALGEY